MQRARGMRGNVAAKLPKDLHAPAPAVLERVKGIEPSYAAWEAAVLPLNYTRGTGGFYCGTAGGHDPEAMYQNRSGGGTLQTGASTPLRPICGERFKPS